MLRELNPIALVEKIQSPTAGQAIFSKPWVILIVVVTAAAVNGILFSLLWRLL
ncbi:MAG TPA: hypothetical protein VNL15_09020 [Dehalococcoidia bacterium]|nr:hypothetical protein [Dehalococcoidia bacterium]